MCACVDAVEPATTVCRAKNGVCDIADNCDGTTKDCPTTDAVEPATTVCRAKNGVCDIADNCDGTTKDCPTTDAVEPATTVCRPSLGCCDQPDNCDGTTKDCPADQFYTTKVCATELDAECDLVEYKCVDGNANCPKKVVDA